MSIVVLVLLVIISLLILEALHYYLLLIASILPERGKYSSDDKEKLAGSDSPKFAIVIPAYNEQALIGSTVTSMLRMRYDQALFDVMVIADNCSDKTAEIARSSGALCFERDNPVQIGKGYALYWFFQSKREVIDNHDAIIIFDADSQPENDFLSVMASYVIRGSAVLQGQHVVANADRNTLTRLAEIGMRLTNRLRNLSRSKLGLSCRLMGDAMCISCQIVKTMPWNPESLVEDRDFGIRLILNGVHIAYVPEAVSRGEAPLDLRVAKNQRLRWSNGVMVLRRKYLLPLLSKGMRDRDWTSLERSLELLMPPYSVMLASSSILTAISLLLIHRNPILFLLSLVSLTSWLFMPIIGLILDKAPFSLFVYAMLGPLYAVWRIWIITMSTMHGRGTQWIRTRRSIEED